MLNDDLTNGQPESRSLGKGVEFYETVEYFFFLFLGDSAARVRYIKIEKLILNFVAESNTSRSGKLDGIRE